MPYLEEVWYQIFHCVGDDRNGHLRSSETEEELQQRLVQLFNLPTQVHVPFTFTEPDHFMADPKESINYITLDCNKLAESLAIIPLHDRLDLNVELLEMGGYSATCSSYEQKVTKDKHSENEPRKIYLPHQIKAMDKLTPYKKQSVLKSELSEKQKPTVPVAPSHAQALPTPTAEQSIAVPTTSDHTVEQSIAVPTTSDHTVEQSIAVPTTSDHTVERNAGSDDSELDSLELRANVNGGVSEMAMQTGTQETDELDDILDELLA